jgi:hypothetical protein
MTAPTPAGWYPDPAGPAPDGSPQLRWWDGVQWSAHVQPAAPVASQPTGGAQPTGQAQYTGQAQQPEQPWPGQPQPGQPQPGQPQPGPARSPLAEPVLVVAQKRKLIELTNEYLVRGADGTVVGGVAEINQSGLKKAARLLSSLDQFLTHSLEVRDSAQRPLMLLTRPAKIVKSTVLVTRPDGPEIGRIVQRNVFGKIRFGLESGGYEVGSINAENWRAWNFSIRDHTDTEIARITKTWEGLATTLFTTADSYVVHIHRPLADPLLSLVVASSLTVDTALKQDDRGFN